MSNPYHNNNPYYSTHHNPNPYPSSSHNTHPHNTHLPHPNPNASSYPYANTALNPSPRPYTDDFDVTYKYTVSQNPQGASRTPSAWIRPPVWLQYRFTILGAEGRPNERPIPITGYSNTKTRPDKQRIKDFCELVDGYLRGRETTEEFKAQMRNTMHDKRARTAYLKSVFEDAVSSNIYYMPPGETYSEFTTAKQLDALFKQTERSGGRNFIGNNPVDEALPHLNDNGPGDSYREANSHTGQLNRPGGGY